MSLNTDANISDPDGFYSDLIALHAGLSDADSHALNTRLVLILCNHIGDKRVLDAAFDLARKAGQSSE